LPRKRLRWLTGGLRSGYQVDLSPQAKQGCLIGSWGGTWIEVIRSGVGGHYLRNWAAHIYKEVVRGAWCAERILSKMNQKLPRGQAFTSFALLKVDNGVVLKSKRHWFHPALSGR